MFYQFPGLEAKSAEFKAELEAVGKRLGIDHNAIAAVMKIESGFSATALNPKGGAVGLIQFMPFVLKSWNLTTDQVRAMPDVQQLALVERFYTPSKGINDPGTLYMRTFLPKYANYPDDFVLGRENDQTVRDGMLLHNIWAQNQGLDTNKNKELTVGEVKGLARGVYNTAKAKSNDIQPGLDLSSVVGIKKALNRLKYPYPKPLVENSTEDKKYYATIGAFQSKNFDTSGKALDIDGDVGNLSRGALGAQLKKLK
jgi:transglycosylase-like protein with SLT domain